MLFLPLLSADGPDVTVNASSRKVMENSEMWLLCNAKKGNPDKYEFR